MRRSERRGALAGTWRARLKDGTQLELPRQSLMSWSVAFTGLYDEATVKQIAGFVRPQTVVLDVGASLGLWTVQLGRLAAARGAQVWAFEPNPANTPWIARNVALNELSGVVTMREIGLGDRAEASTLVSAEYGVGNGAIALREKEGTRKFPRIPIVLGRLDDIDLPAPVSFIKIDTEGYEVSFLRGAAELIERDRPVILGEFARGWLERRGENLRAALLELDYDVATLERPRTRSWRSPELALPRSVDLSGSEPLPQNLLLRPRERHG
ncbi:MAG: FkbM family methyltransferase [Solirubrobacteraceae bacterium]|jgi:FkbM family methyltransferase